MFDLHYEEEGLQNNAISDSNVANGASNIDSEVTRTSNGDVVGNINSGASNAAVGDSKTIGNVNADISVNSAMTNSANSSGGGDTKLDKNEETKNKANCDQGKQIQTGSIANHGGMTKEDTDKRKNWQLQLNGRYETYS